MPSSYTPLLRLTLPADGELVGTWGQTVNNGITSLEEAAIAGTASVALVDADYVMTVANGAADVARNATVRFTGALTAQRNITVPSSSKNYFIRNATTGGFGLNVKTAAGTGVVVPPGGAMLVYCDGVNVLQAIDVSGAVTVTDINGTPDLILKSSGTEKMRILANGNVGIGTVTPTQKLMMTGAAGTNVYTISSNGTQQYIAGVSSSNTILSGALTNDPYLLYSSGTERMRIDAAGNVGIGTNAPSTRLHVANAGAVNTALRLENGVGSAFVVQRDDNGMELSAATAGAYMRFNTGGGVERMRIDAAGKVFVGPTYASTGSTFHVQAPAGVGAGYVGSMRHGDTAGPTYWSFGPNGLNAFVVYTNADIGVYLPYGATAWASNSDERNKTDFVEFDGALAKVGTLRAGTGRYLHDAPGIERPFLFAQDVQALLPAAVSVAPNSDSEAPERLGLVYTDVIPLLVAAIKELHQRVTALGG